MPAPVALHRRLRVHWPVMVLALVAALVAVASYHWLFPALSWNRDEPVYLWHAQLLRAGQLTGTDGGHPTLFHPWLSAHGDGVFFTQYTLGWPLVLAAAQALTGSSVAALSLGAALAVAGTYALARELTGDRAIATGAGAVLLVSPILAIQGGVHLSYLFTLGVGTLFAAAVLSGLRLRTRGYGAGRSRLVVAGVLVGVVFLTRPYDALLWGAATTVAALWLHHERWREVVAALALASLVAAPFVVGALAYNARVTGSWSEFPITAADPLDTFGFGDRRLMPGLHSVEYGLKAAVQGTAKNAFVVPWFLAGSYVGLLVAAWALWSHREERATLPLLVFGAVFPVGYFVFWGNHLSSLAARISGPIYFVPAFAPLAILISIGTLHAWRRDRRWGWVLVVALAIGTVPFAISRFAVNREISVTQEVWRASTADLEPPAVVLVADTGPYLMFTNPFSSNRPDLDDPVLYAAASGPEVLDLLAEQPRRRPYLQEASVAAPDLGPREDPRTDLAIRLRPVQVVRGPSLTLSISVPVPEDGAAVVWVDTGQPGAALPLDGTGSLDLTIGPVGSGTDVELPGRLGTIRITAGFGVDQAAAAETPSVRQALHYRVDGAAIEVLTPGSSQRHEPVGSGRVWRHATDVDDLDVSVR